MKNLFKILLLSISPTLFAQIHHDPDLLAAQRTLGSSQKLPIFISMNGDIKFFKEGANPDLSVSPTIHLGYKKSTLLYVSPTVSSELSLDAMAPEPKWIEYRTVRKEIGIGLRFSDEFHIGILPYKGSFQTTVRSKTSREEVFSHTGLPHELSLLEEWDEGDQGHFQTYGGVMISGRLSVGGISVASAGIGIQNQFLVSLKKYEPYKIELTINEENLNQRRVRIGPSPINLSYYYLQGRLFKASFELDLRNPEHHILYKEALRGNVKKLQENLVNVSERIAWTGQDWNFYFGIPSVAGEVRNRSDFRYGLGEERLYVEGKRTKGELTVFRDHQNYVHQTLEGISVFWTSKMKKVDYKTLKKVFLNRARIMGIKDFGDGMERASSFGSVITHLGLAFTKKEIASLNEESVLGIRESYKERCVSFNLSCSQTKVSNKIFTKLSTLMKQPWLEMRKGLGQLFMHEPALIYAFNKSLDLKKKVYFKFLSGKFQSIEGTSPLSF